MRVSNQQVARWLADLSARPLVEEELGLSSSAEESPAEALQWDAALMLPMWWPAVGPNRSRLSSSQRQQSFRDSLADELNLAHSTRLIDDEPYRRQTIARSLLRMHTDWRNLGTLILES